MKTIIKAWSKSPDACACLIAFVIMDIVYAALDTEVVSRIASTLNGIGDTTRNLAILIVISIIMTILSTFKDKLRFLSTDYVYGDVYNRYAKKVLEADYDLFTKFSVAKITTIGEFVKQISKMGMMFAICLIQVAKVLIILIAIYKLVGNGMFLIAGAYMVCGVIVYAILKKMRVYNSKLHDYRHARNQHMENIINGFNEVRTFRAESRYYRTITYYNALYRKTITDRSNLTALYSFVVDAVCGTVWIVSVIMALRQIGSGVMTPVTALALITYEFRIINPIVGIVEFLDDFLKEKDLGKEFDDLMHYENTTSHDGHITLSEFNKSIVMENVTFSYDDSNQILKGLTMDINKGEHIGICGSSGGGKSTVVKLLNRFYDVDGGSFTVDGIDARDFNISSWRRLFGTVQQENIMLSGTIMNNLRLVNEYATEYEISEACKKAKIYDFIMSLPQKFDTVVGPRGLKLSGGQKQRIALARLFIQDPEIIILDEATAALDNTSEAFVQEAIEHLQDKTIITIAHRLSTIRNCDRIYVIENGTVDEVGTHEELLHAGGTYCNMVKKAESISGHKA